jgi:hypothetical protein
VTGSFEPTGVVRIEFNRPVTVNKAQLVYVRQNTAGTGYDTFGTTLTSGSLSTDRTLLTLNPAYLLAPSSAFLVKIKVTDDNGNVLVYDAADDPAADTTNYIGGAAKGDIGFIKTRALTSSNEVLSGKAAKPIANSLTVTGITPAGTQLTNPINSGLGTTSFTLSYTPEKVSFSTSYTYLKANNGVWTNGGSFATSVLAGYTTPALTSSGLFGLTNAVWYRTNQIQYKIRGISDEGYVTDSNAVSIGFTN